MSFGGGGDGSGISTEINVTPLCDIFVVLLIILMMAHDEANQIGPAIDLPVRFDTPPEDKTPENDNVTLTITRDPTYVYLSVGGESNSKACTMEDLPAAVGDAFGRSKRPVKEAMVRAHANTPLERVVKVIGIAYSNGATKVGIGTMLRDLNK